MTYNEYFLGLHKEKQLILLADKWMMSHDAWNYQQKEIHELKKALINIANSAAGVIQSTTNTKGK